MGANQTVIKVKLDFSSQETQNVCCKVQLFNSIAERFTTVLKKVSAVFTAWLKRQQPVKVWKKVLGSDQVTYEQKTNPCVAEN